MYSMASGHRPRGGLWPGTVMVAPGMGERSLWPGLPISRSGATLCSVWELSGKHLFLIFDLNYLCVCHKIYLT